MKNKKGILIFSGIVLILVLMIVFMNFTDQKNKKNIVNNTQKVDDIKNDDKLIIGNGIIYTGKVIPYEIKYYLKDPSKEFKQNYVMKNDIVKKGDLLFSYQSKLSNTDQIMILEKTFKQIEASSNSLYNKLAELKTWLKESNDQNYNEYLKNEINNVELLIAKNNLELNKNQETINHLKNSDADNLVLADIDALVYNIASDHSNDPLNNNPAYMTLLSLKRKVRISVSEYEYRLFKVDKKVKVKIESLDKEFDAKITYLDLLPNNLNSSDASYYNIDIEIPEEVPYGYSAIIEVLNNDLN